MECVVECGDPSLRNVVRRGILKYAKSLAIESVESSVNTTQCTTDLLTLHLQLLPIAQQMDDSVRLHLNAKNEYKGSFKYILGSEITSIPAQPFPICDPELAIMTLGPGEEIACEMRLGYGYSMDHEKFNLIEPPKIIDETRLLIKSLWAEPIGEHITSALGHMCEIISSIRPSDVTKTEVVFEPGGLVNPVDRAVLIHLAKLMGGVANYTYNSPITSIQVDQGSIELKRAKTTLIEQLESILVE